MNRPLASRASQEAASKLLLSLAATTSSFADKFSNWLAIGLGAVLSLIIGNIDKLAKYMDVDRVKTAVFIYIVILILVLIQKRISVAVLASHAGDSIAREIISNPGEEGINPEFILQQLVAATLRPRKWQLQRTYRKIAEKRQAGDTVWPARRVARKAQRQEWLVFLQAALSLYVIWLLAVSINKG